MEAIDLKKILDFSGIKPGDVITRVFGGTSYWEAHVFRVETGVIYCTVSVDVPRTMLFTQSTGVNTLGIDYGFLVNVPPPQNQADVLELRQILSAFLNP
ncbi:MAG TPA: hypothetical protein VEA59_02930 [Patescibacteria group bacterium]|nr:hypothetical protein [Patescibacteria group bacterium]